MNAFQKTLLKVTRIILWHWNVHCETEWIYIHGKMKGSVFFELAVKSQIRWGFLLSVCTKTPILLPTWKWIVHAEVMFTLWEFCIGKFQDGRQTAGQLESALRVNKTSEKAFEPRTSLGYCILANCHSLNWFSCCSSSQEPEDYWHYLPWLSVWTNFTILVHALKHLQLPPNLVCEYSTLVSSAFVAQVRLSLSRSELEGVWN